MSEVEARSSGSGKMMKWAVFGLLILAVVTVVMNLPRGFSDDLSLIGTGKPAVVLVRDKNTVESQVLMDVLDKVRGRYSGRVEFLLTDYDTQQGRKFVADHHAASTTLVLFDADGKQLKILTAPQTAASLEQAITNIIGAKI
jgi:thioredoxin-like negative regulator of GroEL